MQCLQHNNYTFRKEEKRAFNSKIISQQFYPKSPSHADTC